MIKWYRELPKWARALLLLVPCFDAVLRLFAVIEKPVASNIIGLILSILGPVAPVIWIIDLIMVLVKDSLILFETK